MSCSGLDRLWFAATHSEQPGSECDSSWPGPTAKSQQSRFREKTTAKRFAKVLLLPIPQSLAIQIWTVNLGSQGQGGPKANDHFVQRLTVSAAQG